LALLVFCLVGVQLLLLLLLGVALARWKQATPPASQPPVSVIVCAHDEEPNLRELVPLLLQQTYPHFELIIVDDRSNDSTYDYLLALTATEPRVKMVRVTHTPAHIPGKKFALTLGIRAATHELILVTDADCRPVSSGWIEKMMGTLQPSHDFVIGISPYRDHVGFLNLFIRYESMLAAVQMAGFALLGMPYMGVGRNLLYRKELFLRGKGFNRHLQVTSGDDDLFLNEHATRSNVAVCLEPETLMISEPKTTWPAFFTQKVRHLSAGKHYRFRHRAVLGVFAISLVASALLVVPVTAVGASAALLAVLGVRWLALTMLLQSFSNRLRIRFEWWWVPVLDFVYAIYYLVAGPIALFAKKVRWKN
jgi:cellulose synthase/poly-beta-1,6-N-acetylglucosamine synthase-like glycosyltransferase